jgi:ABC-type polysaccharide/polyol phosphate export permease
MFNHLVAGIQDLVNGLRKSNVALFFAWGDTKSRYRRSGLGPIWIVLSTAVSVAGLGYLWSLLLKDDPAKLVPSLTVGLVIWQFIAGCVTEAPALFLRNAHFIRNMEIPYSLFLLQLLAKQLINLAHNSIVVIVVMFVLHPNLDRTQFLIIPNLLLVIGNLAWVAILIAVFNSRFRDIEQIIGAVMPLLFFLSPVIYRPSQLELGQWMVWLNPFSYFITLIRDPIMGHAPPAFVYLVTLSSLGIGGIFALYQLGKVRGKIPFWL